MPEVDHSQDCLPAAAQARPGRIRYHTYVANSNNHRETIHKDKLDCKAARSDKSSDIPPIFKWTKCGLPNAVLALLAQRASFRVRSPMATSGRDVIWVASTVIGKSLAYLSPLVLNCLHGNASTHVPQTQALILCPTRELAQQIHVVNLCAVSARGHLRPDQSGVACTM